jgi:2-polyprenyl-6-hydroxyphenyl methylase/3-demethylubiquinone-9 3-methyltransferase
MNHATNIDTAEVSKFSNLSPQWWDLDGPCAPLHVLNPVRLKFIQQHCKLANKTILDVGCGAGILSESLATAGAKVVALDASAELIASARTHAAVQQLHIDYRHSTIEDYLLTTPQPFDAITCMELIEHVPDPSKLIAACAQLLKPGGQMFISTLNRTPKAYALAIIGAEYILQLLPKQTHDYKKFIRPAELAQMLSKNQLQLKTLAGVKYQPFTKTASITNDVSVNYMAYASKEI